MTHFHLLTSDLFRYLSVSDGPHILTSTYLSADDYADDGDDNGDDDGGH